MHHHRLAMVAPAFLLPAPVKDSTGKVLAVLVMSVDAEDLWRELHKEIGQLGKGWNVALTDKYGVRIDIPAAVACYTNPGRPFPNRHGSA